MAGSPPPRPAAVRPRRVRSGSRGDRVRSNEIDKPDKLRPHHTESRGPSRAPRMPHVTLANNNNNNITAVSIHIMHGWRPYMYTPIYTTNSTYNTPVHNNPALALCATHRGNCRREYGVNVYSHPWTDSGRYRSQCIFLSNSRHIQPPSFPREYGVNEVVFTPSAPARWTKGRYPDVRGLA